MFNRASRWFNTGKKKPIRNNKKATPKSRLSVEVLEDRLAPAAFTPGDIVVVQVGAGNPSGGTWSGASTTAPNDNGTAVFLDEYTPAGTFVQQIAMPTAASGSNAPFALGNNNSEGLLNLSTDGQDLLIAGYDTVPQGISAGVDNGSEDRVVGVINSFGSVDTSTVLSAGDGIMGANVREAAGSVANGFYVAGQSKGLAGTFQTGADGGVAFVPYGGSTGTDLIGGATMSNYGPGTLNNGRGVEIFNNQVYLVQDKDTAEPAIMSVNTASSTGLQEPTNAYNAGTNPTTALPLPGTGATNVTPVGGSAKTGDFFLAKIGSAADFDINGVDSGYNTLYVADQGGYGISKYTWNNSSSTWSADGTIGNATTYYEGLAGSVNGTTVTFYATQTGPTTGNTVVTIVDNTGFGGSISSITPTALSGTTIPTADAGVIYRGIAFVPQGGSSTSTTTAVPTVSPTGTQPYGTSEIFSAVVTASSGATAPTAGSVEFESGTTVLATATMGMPSGNATTFTVSSTTVPVGGPYTNITAVYLPGTGFQGSTSSPDTTDSLTITGTSTTTAVPTFTPTTAIVGASVSFSATVTASMSGFGAPTAGTVTFESGSTVLATATSVASTNNLSSTFTASSTTIPFGTYTNITAVYSGNGAFTTSTSSASSATLTITTATPPAGTIAQWNFENDPISGAPPYNNSPAPSYGTGTASAIGMTNSYNSTTSTNSDDVLAGASGDTGTNNLADTTQIWRVRGQSPGNGWSSQAPIGTQGVVFATSTVGISGPINLSFDWYATTQGEANLQLEYTTNGTTWTNVPITVPAADTDVAALTNSTSSNTVMGSYVQISGGQQWAPNLTATINDPNADNNPNFAIELVNASTGADDISASGTPLNNTSGNWRFDNITVSTPPGPFTPGDIVVLQEGDGVTQYTKAAPVFLDEYTPAGVLVEQVAIPNNEVVGGVGNQPLTLDIGDTADKNGNGTGQLSDSFDGTELVFGGNDANTNSGSFTSDYRVIAQVGVNPSAPGGINTTTYGPFNTDDDLRQIAEYNASTIYDAGKATPISDGGLRYFNGLTTGGGTAGVEVSSPSAASGGTNSNVRSVDVAFNGEAFYTSAQGTAGAGVYVSTLGGTTVGNVVGVNGNPIFLPTQATSVSGAQDTQIIPDPAGSANKINGVYVADMNGDGVLDAGDKVYFMDPGTGLWSSTFQGGSQTNPADWSTAVNIAPAGSTSLTNEGLTGQVISSTETILYYTGYDGHGNTALYEYQDGGTGPNANTQTTLLMGSSATDKGLSYSGVAFAPEAATTLTESLSSNSIQPGGTVTLTANVSSPNGTPTGYIFFIDTGSGTPVVLNPGGSAISGGVATFADSSLAVGQYDIYAYYSGTSTIAAATTSSQIVSVTGDNASSVTTPTASPSPGALGGNVTLSATVSNNSGNGSLPTPTGTVAFYNGTTLLGTTTLNGSGVASLTVTTLPLGANTNITAEYLGDANYLGYTSAAGSETINPGATITVGPSTYGFTTPGSNVIFTATVNGNGLGQNGSPSGQVEFFEDGGANPFATVTLTGSGNSLTANGTLTGITAGSHVITATYVPDMISEYATTNTAAEEPSVAPYIETATQGITPGDLMVLRRETDVSNQSGLAYLDEYTPGGAFVQTIILPDVQEGANVTDTLSDKQATEGALVRSGNGAYISVFGFDLPVNGGDPDNISSATEARVVANIGANGTVSTTTAITVPGGTALTEPHGAVTYDGNQFWVAGDSSGTSGIEYAPNGATSATPITPSGSGSAIEIVGGNLFVSNGSGVIDEVGTGGLSTTDPVLTPLPGLAADYTGNTFLLPKGGTAGPNPYSFLLFNHVTGTGVDPDTLFIADQTYGLLKFYNSTEINGNPLTGTWVPVGQKLSTNGGIEGLSGYETFDSNGNFTGFQLYATAALSLGDPGQELLSFTDTNAYNQGYSQGMFNTIGSGVDPEASYSGLSFGPGATTGTTLSATTPTTYGNNVTFTATVTAGIGGVTPTGLVGFYDGVTLLGYGTISTVGSNQVATFTTSNYLSVGNHTISAVFVPGGMSAAYDDVSTGTVVQQINYDPPGDLIVTQVGFSSPIMGTPTVNTTAQTVTVTTANPLPFALNATGVALTISGNTGINGAFGSSSPLSVPITILSQNSFSYSYTGTAPTPTADGTVSAASEASFTSVSVSNNVVKLTFPANPNFTTGEQVSVSGAAGTGINGTFFISSTSSPSSAGPFVWTVSYASVGAVAGSSGGVASALASTATGTYLLDYSVNPTTGVATLNPANTVTLPTATENTPAPGTNSSSTIDSASWNISNDMVTVNTGVSVIPTAATWTAAASTNNGAFATITAPNNFYTGQTVIVSGIGGTSGGSFNGTFTILSATLTQFTYLLATQPTGTPTFTGAMATGGHSLLAGEQVTIVGITSTGGSSSTAYDGTFTVLSVPTPTSFTYGILTDPGSTTSVSGATAVASQNALTEGGTSTTSGYLTDSVDGHTLEIAGNDTAPGGSNNGLSDVAVVSPNGTVNDSTLLPSSVGSARATISADGQGFYVATSTGLEYVPFGGSTPSAVTAAAWVPDLVGTAATISGITESSTTATVTTTTAHGLLPGEQVWITGTSVSGYNNIDYTVLSVTSPTVFTVKANSGTLGSATGGTAQQNVGGTATISAPNFYSAGQTVSVSGIGGATGFNGSFVILSVTGPAGAPTGFTYFLATQPNVTSPATFTTNEATSQLVPTVVTTEANNPTNSGQTPVTVTIGTDLNGNTNQLLADAGNQYTLGGIDSVDGPLEVNGNLPTNAGNTITIYGTGANTNFPTATDRFGGFPTSAQFAVSPDGQTVFVADSRTDGLGGVLEYYQVAPPTPQNPNGTWRLYGNIQLDSFSVSGATETGSTVTITGSNFNFTSGESVQVVGLVNTAYDATYTVLATSGSTSFTAVSSFTGLTPSGVLPGGAAVATLADGGVRGLAADFTNNGANNGGVILYVTTSGTSGNRLIEVTGGSTLGSPTTLTALNIDTPTTTTAAPGTAFRGVAFAPLLAGTSTTGETNTLSISGNTLSAAVTPADATGWVSFYESNGTYIGDAPINSGTAMLNTTGVLPAGTYNGVYATYTGNSTYAALTSAPMNLIVSAIGTSTALTFSPGTIGTNQTDTLTATISANTSNAGGPTGLVTFTTAAVGSSGINTLSVSGSTVTVVTSAAVPLVVGQSVTITGNSGTNGTFVVASVSGNASGTTFTFIASGATAGTGGSLTAAQFTLGYGTVSQVINSGVNSFVATLTTTLGEFGYGIFSITASYSGDAYFSLSSNPNTLNVVNATTTTVTSNQVDPTASTGQPVTLTATPTSTVSGSITGTVQFYDNTLLLGQTATNPTGTYPVSGGVATLTVPTSLVQSVTVLGASVVSTGPSAGTVTITTNANNAFFVGEQVVVQDIQTGNYNSAAGTFFTVTNVSGATFQYMDTAAEGSQPATSPGGNLGIGQVVAVDVLTPGTHSITAVFTSTASAFAGSIGVHEQTVQATGFGASDVFSLRNGDGIISLNSRVPETAAGSIGVTQYIDELTPSGTLVQSIILPSADSQIFTAPSTGTTATVSSNTVTLLLTSPTDFTMGQTVTIAGVSVAADNGDFTISAVSNTAPYSISYTDSNSSIANGTGGTAQGTIHAVVGDGQQSTTSQLTLSGNGQYLFADGYDNNPLPLVTGTSVPLPVPSASAASSVPRSIARIAGDGSIQTEAFTTGVAGIDSTSGNSGVLNGIYSPDGNQFYISSFEGIYYFPSFTNSATLQGSQAANLINEESYTFDGLEGYGGQLYAIGSGNTSGTDNRIQEVGAGLPHADGYTIMNAAWSGGVATITTNGNNDYTTGESVYIAGITGATGFNGTFTVVTGSGGGNTFTYALATQPTGTAGYTNATVNLQVPLTQVPGIPLNTTVGATPIAVYDPTDAYFTQTNLSTPAGTPDTIYISDSGRAFGSGAVTKWTLTSEAVTGSITVSGTTATATVPAGLNLVQGESVNLTLSGNTEAALNGIFAVTVTSGTLTGPATFTFTVPTGTTTSASAATASGYVEQSDGFLYAEASSQVGFYWLAGKTTPASGSTPAVVTLYSTYGNGGNFDPGPGLTYDFTDSNGFGNNPGTPITAAAYNSGTNMVTITAANNFQTGQTVEVAGVLISGSTMNGYNGLFTITSANGSTFSYTPTTTPTSNTGTIGAAGTTYAVELDTLQTVAYQGPGSYSGSETTRGVALAPTPAVSNPAPTLSSINPPSTYIDSSAVTITLTGTGFITSSVVDFNGTPISTTYVSASSLTAVIPAADLTTAGADNITVVNPAPGGGTSGAVTFTVNNVLIVTSTQQTASGIIINFNQPINTAVLNEFGKTISTTAPPTVSNTGGAAVTVTNGGSTVEGSLILSNNNTTAYFVTEGSGTSGLGLLPTGANTLSLLSGATGFETPGGIALTGSYQTSYVVSSTAPAVGVPDFARGPGQTDAAGFPFASGIPVQITNGSGLTTATVTMTYHTNLLTVTNVTTPLSGYSISGLSITTSGTIGTVTFTVSGGAALGSGVATIADLVYTIPNTAAYGSKATVQVSSASINGGAIAVQDADAVQILAYPGDVNAAAGTGSALSQTVPNAGEASTTLADAAAGNGVAFGNNVLVDPKILAFGDTIGAGQAVSAGDASNILNAAARNTLQTQLPITPTGFTPLAEVGHDPALNFSSVSGLAGSTVTVALNLTVPSTSSYNLSSADINFTYDSSVLTITNIALGTLDQGYLISTNTSTPGVGYIGIATTSNVLAAGTTGTIAVLTFTISSGASVGSTAVVHLAPTGAGAPTETDSTPSDVSPYPTNSYNSAIDGTVTVSAPTVTLSWPTISASAGQTITVPVNMLTDTAVNFSSADLNLTYDSTKLAVVGSPTVGTLDNGYLISSNTSTPGQIYIGVATTSNSLNSGTTGSIALVTFQVLSTATGSAYLDIVPTGPGAPTEVDSGAVALSPNPGNDGAVNIVVTPEAPPYDYVPPSTVIATTLGGTGVLFNPATGAGLQTATPNTVVFNTANTFNSSGIQTSGDTITVTDSTYSSSGPAETTTVSITGNPGATSTGLVGTLTATATGGATVSGGGTSPLVISGSPTAITATLATMIYTPGAGYFGTTVLTVSTDDNANNDFGGPLIDTRTTSITVVGMFISEINLNRNSTTAVSNTQYVEVFSTAPNYLIPSSVNLVGIDGNKVTGAPAVGTIEDIFKLGGFTTGSNGYLALLEKSNPYTSVSDIVSGGLAETQSSGTGFGNGTTSVFNLPSGGQLTNVHIGPSGTTRTGFSAPSQFTNDLLTGSVSYLLIQSPTTLTSSTIGVTIDNSGTGSNTVTGGTLYPTWNVFDSVGLLRNANGTSGDDRSYGAITYKATANTTGTIIAGSNLMSPAGAYTADYVGRIAETTADSNVDWLASNVTGGTAPAALSSTQSTQFGGQQLNSIGGPNYWAPGLSVMVNDGSSPQHSIVSELTLTFSEPVNIVDLTSDFQVIDASGNPLSINVTDPIDGSTTIGATGPVSDTDVTSLIVTFNLNTGAAAADTYAYANGATDALGNTVSLNNGNYFLRTVVADVTNNSVALDGAHTGVGGSTTPGNTIPYGGQGTYEVDEFWRLFGDVNGTRTVDGLSAYAFSQTDGSTAANLSDNVASATAQGNVVTITTVNDSPFVVGQTVIISGVTVNGSTNNAYNGTFIITSVNAALGTFTYTALTALSGPADVGTGSITTPTYVWYLDYNQVGDVNVNGDATQFFNDLFNHNGGTNYLAP